MHIPVVTPRSSDGTNDVTDIPKLLPFSPFSIDVHCYHYAQLYRQFSQFYWFFQQPLQTNNISSFISASLRIIHSYSKFTIGFVV